jgi:hypothetical protein
MCGTITGEPQIELRHKKRRLLLARSDPRTLCPNFLTEELGSVGAYKDFPNIQYIQNPRTLAEAQ